jgi:cholesterol transport system auxiliary component
MHVSKPLACFVLLAVQACSLLTPHEAPPALHDFGARTHVRIPAYWSTVTVDAAEWLEDERIHYRLRYADPTRVRFYAAHRWLAAPSSLLAQRLSIAESGHGYRLHIRLVEFEQIFDKPKHARAILGFLAEADEPNCTRSKSKRVFRFSRPTPSADAGGAVVAFGALIEEATVSLARWLTELPLESPTCANKL